MHYLENVRYHVREAEDSRYPVGHPMSVSTRLKFDGCPFTFELRDEFIDYLIEKKPTEINSMTGEKPFFTKYTLGDYAMDSPSWHYLPIDDKRTAEEIAMAIKAGMEPNKVRIVTKRNEAYTPTDDDIRKARLVAIAPEATLEQLRDTEWLVKRIPYLVKGFIRDIEELGFKY